jgi:hypothetical protein
MVYEYVGISKMKYLLYMKPKRNFNFLKDGLSHKN